MKKSVVTLALLSVFVVSACSTPEWRTENASCQAQWNTKIPVRMEERRVQRIRFLEVADGSFSCVSHNLGGITTTNCEPNKKQVEVPYTVIESFDVNKKSRDEEVASCTSQSCVTRFGNADCKAK